MLDGRCIGVLVVSLQRFLGLGNAEVSLLGTRDLSTDEASQSAWLVSSFTGDRRGMCTAIYVCLSFWSVESENEIN